MGAAALALQGAGAVTSAYGAYSEGLAESSYYRSLASKSRQEAESGKRFAEQESTLAQDAAARDTKMFKRDVAELEGAQTAAAAANGTAGSVTGADIARDTFTKSKMDEMSIRYDADLKSFRANEQARLNADALEREAQGYDIAGRAAKKGAKGRAASSLLSGAGQVASSWYSLNNSKPSAAPKPRN